MSEAKIKEMQAALKQSPKEITFSDYCAKCPLKLAKDEYVAPKK